MPARNVRPGAASTRAARRAGNLSFRPREAGEGDHPKGGGGGKYEYAEQAAPPPPCCAWSPSPVPLRSTGEEKKITGGMAISIWPSLAPRICSKVRWHSPFLAARFPVVSRRQSR